MEDFVKRRIVIPENKYIYYSKAVALAWGALTMGFGFFSGKIASTAIEAINKIGSLFYGPILAIFLLAGLRFVKPLAANLAVVVGVLVNLILWLYFKNVFWFWWNAIGGITTLSVGMLLSFVLPGDAVPLPAAVQVQRVFPWREVCILVLFFGCILTFCALLPRLF